MSAPRIARTLAATAALGAFVVGCGASNYHSAGSARTKIGIAGSENDGVYVNAGPITYQLEVSRQLNQYSTEDSQYLAGLSGSTTLGARQLWYGVFLWAKNQTKSPQRTTAQFVIQDTQGHRYYPVAISHASNPYVWTSQVLAPGQIEPLQDTTASFGPTQGGLLLFKLDSSVYDDRPLTLDILGPSRQVWGTISLDL